MEDFSKYLKELSSTKVGKKALFVPDWGPVEVNELKDAEKRLGCTLPSGYRIFLETLGVGSWAEAFIKAPADLYAFDEAVGEMCGFIALADGIEGCGNYVAFNPRDQKIYYCCHDPFGYALLDRSFEGFIKQVAAHWQKTPQTDVSLFYKSLSPFVDATITPVAGKSLSAKPWWEFWK
jgi:hypothetical protein